VTAKMSAARRAAFLDALEATGNQMLAAEAAKVSRSWVQLQRSTDPDFDAAVRARVAAAKARLGGAEEAAPASGWGFLDGEELVVRGTGGSGGGKSVQVARARLKQWTPRVEDRFLAVLQATCNVKAACAAVGMSATSAYNHRKRWPGFARRWREAEEVGTIRLDWALVECAQNLASRRSLPPAAPMPALSTDEILHSLYMHGHLRGMGRPPGRFARGMTFEEASAILLYKIEAIERAEALSEADKAALREEWSRRRPDASLPLSPPRPMIAG
jgi:hypothetical protein